MYIYMYRYLSPLCSIYTRVYVGHRFFFLISNQSSKDFRVDNIYLRKRGFKIYTVLKHFLRIATNKYRRCMVNLSNQNLKTLIKNSTRISIIFYHYIVLLSIVRARFVCLRSQKATCPIGTILSMQCISVVVCTSFRIILSFNNSSRYLLN